VQVDLLVRGICCLRPGVPGLSENIRVRSIIGRYLEHSRIFVFANGRGPGVPEYLTGSADLMPRNLDRRVEVLLSVRNEAITARLDEILAVALADEQLAWSLDPDGTWRRLPVPGGIDSHTRFQELASSRVEELTTSAVHAR
jgi:polyphosphate kinase